MSLEGYDPVGEELMELRAKATDLEISGKYKEAAWRYRQLAGLCSWPNHEEYRYRAKECELKAKTQNVTIKKGVNTNEKT
jgi:hypothetical protein